MKKVKEADIKSLMETPTDFPRIIFRFLMSPTSSTCSTESNKYLSQISFCKNKLSGQAFSQKAIIDDSLKEETLPCDIVIPCIGFKSLPLKGEPFDEKNNIIPNSGGCVLTGPGAREYYLGKYVAGWIKTGPVGVLDATFRSSEETFNNIRLHIENDKLSKKPDPRAEIEKIIESSNAFVTSFDDFLRLDKEEIRLGELERRSRIKFNSVDSIKEFLSS